MFRAVCLALFGCASPAAPIANVAPIAPTRCMTTSDCIAACNRAVPGSCLRASRFVLFQLDYVSTSDVYEESIGFATKGCSAGELAACVIAGNFRAGEQPEVARGSLARACDGKIAGGCLGLVKLTPEPAAKQQLIDRSRSGFEAACAAGDGDACTSLAAMYGANEGFYNEGPPLLGKSEPQIERYLRLAIASYERACLAGEALACIDRIWLYQNPQLGKQQPHPQMWADRACKLVGAREPKCWQGDEPTAYGYEEAGRL